MNTACLIGFDRMTGNEFALIGSELWLMNLEGEVQKLAENLSKPAYYFFNYPATDQKNNTTAIFWSPQDDYLVVNSGAEVWLVEPEK